MGWNLTIPGPSIRFPDSHRLPLPSFCYVIQNLIFQTPFRPFPTGMQEERIINPQSNYRGETQLFWMVSYFIQDAKEKNEPVITHDVKLSNKAHMRRKRTRYADKKLKALMGSLLFFLKESWNSGKPSVNISYKI